MNFLFVCTGNLCRSITAHKLLEKAAKDKGFKIQVKSCGVLANPNAKTPDEVKQFLSDKGADLGAHRPVYIAEELINWADIILVMERFHYDVLAEKFPQSARKMKLFADYCFGKKEDMPDPYGKTPRAYKAALERISDGVKTIAKKISG